MRFEPLRLAHFRPRMAIAVLPSALFLVLLVAACGGSGSTSRVVVVTATSIGFLETAESEQQPSLEVAPTERPLESEELAASKPTETLTSASEPTSSPRPTETPVPEDTPDTPTPKPTSTPKASLASYRVVYGNFDGGDRYNEYGFSLWMMRGDGQQAAELLRPAFQPSFSADGKKIAYYRPFSGIWLYDIDTGSNTPLVSANYAEFGGFSPDGQRLTFHERHEVSSDDVNVYVVNADGSGRTKLVPGMRPAWSPHGGLIAFDTCRDSGCGIYVVQPDGQGFRQITDDVGGGVTWSPDGEQLVYYSRMDGDAEIYMVNLDGSGKRQLTYNPGEDAMPVFSPDGKCVYFISNQDGTAWTIRAMMADGSEVKTIRNLGIIGGNYQFSRLWITWW